MHSLALLPIVLHPNCFLRQMAYLISEVVGVLQHRPYIVQATSSSTFMRTASRTNFAKRVKAAHFYFYRCAYSDKCYWGDSHC